MTNKSKTFFLLLGDLAALYVALFIALIIRYGGGFSTGGFYDEFVNIHLVPFTIIFIPWLIIFYIAGLYDLRRLRNNIEFLKILGTSIVVDALVAILLFYLVPAFGIAPKTNLFRKSGVPLVPSHNCQPDGRYCIWPDHITIAPTGTI